MKWQQIGFGGGALSGEGGGYGFGPLAEKEALAVLDYVFERGLHVFDLAPIYGYGLAEERIGKAFRHRREKIMIIDKGGVDWHENKRVNMSNHPRILEKMLEQSLKRLQTDYIDLYLIHWPDPQVDICEALGVLERAREKGKILKFGLSNPLKKDYLKAKDHFSLSALQFEYNFFRPQNLDEWASEHCEYPELQFYSWGTFDKGILSGRVQNDRTYHQSDARAWAPWWKKDKRERERKLQQVELLKAILGPLQVSLLQFALEFNQKSMANLCSLCGSKSINDWQEIFTLLENPLPSDLWQEIWQQVNEKNA